MSMTHTFINHARKGRGRHKRNDLNETNNNKHTNTSISKILQIPDDELKSLQSQRRGFTYLFIGGAGVLSYYFYNVGLLTAIVIIILSIIIKEGLRLTSGYPSLWRGVIISLIIMGINYLILLVSRNNNWGPDPLIFNQYKMIDYYLFIVFIGTIISFVSDLIIGGKILELRTKKNKREFSNV